MIHIERLFVNRPGFLDIHSNTSPGLVDIFTNPDNSNKYLGIFVSNTAAFYGTAVMQRLRDHDIQLGSIYGTNGITVEQLLQQSPQDDVYYELSIDNYLCLSPVNQQLLCEQYRLILHDYTEGGRNLFYHHPRAIKFPAKNKDIVIITSSYEQYDYVGNNVRSTTVPMFAHITVSKFAEKNIAREPDWRLVPEKLALVPVLKPKAERLRLLSTLHRKQLLDNCTWSFAAFKDNSGKWQLEGINSTNGLALNVTEIEEFRDFFHTYESILPKTLHNEQIINYDVIAMNSNWFRSHMWYVSAETDQNRLFITEKTFKGMMLGMPVLTVAGVGFNQQIQQLGFVMQGDFDHLSGEERAAAVVEHMLTACPDVAAAKHNFDLLNNHEFMVKLATQPLIDLFYASQTSL